jgi:hypothetical protein
VRALPSLDSRGIGAFEAEASRLVKLRHPGIVSLLDYGVDKTVPFLVSEFVQAESLDVVLSRGDLSPKESLSLLRQAAAAIDYAHAAGIVHGNLQLQGVLADAMLHPHIANFGLAQLAGPDGTPPTGSNAYRAPEQLRAGEPAAAADRYSFAAIASVVVEHATFDPAVGAAVDAVIARGLAQDPSRRWPSGSAMVDALGRALEPAPVPAAAQTKGAGVWIALAAAAGVAILALLLLVNKPAAGPTAPPGAAMSLSRTAVAQGGTLVVSGTNLPANQAGTVELQSRGQQIGAFAADQNGSFSVSVTVPQNISKGDHVVKACWDNGCPLESTVTVLASPQSPPTPAASSSPSATATASASASASP